jgi:membrane-bound lytic murein transglycosylase D
MPDSGRAYGLAIDRWVDERFDPQRSTEAACRFLSDLYLRYGSWELAMAAYNMGHGGLSRAIRKYNTNDFWELARYEAGLPWETTLYVPKIVATAIVMTNRRNFGLDDVEPEPAEKFDTVRVAPGVRLADLSRLIGASASLLEELNPQYLSGRTPPATSNAGRQSWAVRVPLGSGTQLSQALARETPSDESLVSYVVRTGDTVESIAQLRGTTEVLLRSLNRIDSNEALAPGTVLLLPRGSGTEREHATDNVVVISPRTFRYTDRKRVFYRVESGDSVARIAEAFGATRGDVVLWNALDDSARLHAGMTLELYVSNSRDLSRVRHIPEHKARILVAGSPEFFDYFEGQNGKRRFVVRSKGGETLAKIGKRYGMTVGSMERANRRSRTDPLQAGEPVVVYTERTRPAPGDQLYVDVRASSPAQLGGGVAAVADSAAPD